MGNAVPIKCVILEDSTLTMMARVDGNEAELINRATIAAARYTVRRLDPKGLVDPTPIAGHTEVSIPVAQSIFDELQGAGGSDPRWTIDEIGYNFRYQIDVLTTPAFATVGDYQVNIVLTPVAGQEIHMRFAPKVI